MSRLVPPRKLSPKRPEGPHRRMAPSHSLALELGWTIGPALVILAIAVPTLHAVLAADPSGDLSVPLPAPVQEELLNEPGVPSAPEAETGNGANTPG